jgi:hypothetical protein
MNYRLLIDYEVIEFLETISRQDQRRVRDCLVAIRDNPQPFSDYTEPDHTSRQVDIHICGKYAIKFWQDHADRHIKILNVHLADRPRP